MIGLIVVIATLVCPRWALLAGAAVATRLMPGEAIVGPFAPADLLLLIFIVRWGTTAIGSASASRPDVSTVLWLGAFLGWAWLSLALADSFEGISALGRVTLYAAVFAAATTDPEQGRPLLRFIALYAATEAALALLGVTPRLGSRILGFYGDPGQTGLLMIAGLAATMILRPPFRYLVLSLIGSAVALSFTRTIWAAAILSLSVMIWPKLQRRPVRLGVAVAAGVAAAWWLAPIVTDQFGLYPGSIALRLQSWSAGIDLVQTAPLFGHGWALQSLGPGTLQPFNLWINVAASSGLVGAALLAAFVVRLLRRLTSTQNLESRVWLPYLVGFMVVSLAEMTIWAGGAATIEFFAVTGVVLGSVSMNAGEAGSPSLTFDARRQPSLAAEPGVASPDG